MEAKDIDFGDPKLGLFKVEDETFPGIYNYYCISEWVILGAIVSPEQLRTIADEMEKDKHDN